MGIVAPPLQKRGPHVHRSWTPRGDPDHRADRLSPSTSVIRMVAIEERMSWIIFSTTMTCFVLFGVAVVVMLYKFGTTPQPEPKLQRLARTLPSGQRSHRR